MSKSAAQVADVFFPGTGTVGSAASSAVVDSLTPDLPAAQDLPTRGDPANDLPKQTTQVATREQQQRVALAASGVTKSANQRDLLGGKTRDASRALLGGR